MQDKNLVFCEKDIVLLCLFIIKMQFLVFMTWVI